MQRLPGNKLLVVACLKSTRSKYTIRRSVCITRSVVHIICKQCFVIVDMLLAVFENMYFTFFQISKKHDFLRFFEMTYQKVVKSHKKYQVCSMSVQKFWPQNSRMLWVLTGVITFTQLHCFLCPHFWARCLVLVTVTDRYSGILTYGNSVIKGWVIKWPVKLYVRFFTFLRSFFSKSKKPDFLRFFELLHTFSRTLVACQFYQNSSDPTVVIERADLSWLDFRDEPANREIVPGGRPTRWPAENASIVGDGGDVRCD